MANKTHKNYKKIIYNLIIIFLLSVMVFCAVKIVSYYMQGSKSKDINNSLINEYVEFSPSVPEESQSTESASSSPSQSVTPKPYYQAAVPKSINFKSLKEKNNEVIGWIFNKNGVINYPVMQTNDNAYYLDHLIDGRKNANGSIFADFENSPDFTDYNTFIYGHSMKNGTMFATLLRYRNQDYYNAYPLFYLYTPNGDYTIEIFSAYQTTSNDTVYTFCKTKEQFASYLEHLKKSSKIVTDVTVTDTDRVVVLSTCAYTSDQARFVVIGKLCPVDGENTQSKQ